MYSSSPLSRRHALALMGATATTALFGTLPAPVAADDPMYFPPLTGDDWETVAPAAVGWNEAALDDALRFAEVEHSTAVVILQRGKIVAERYWDGWDTPRSGIIASAAKSVVSVLTGIAQENGLLDITRTVNTYLGAGWSRAGAANEAQITVRHLLTMTSGLDDNLRFVADAGTLWYYNTSAYYRVKDVVEHVSGMSMNDYTQNVLWSKIGMTRSRWFNNSMAASARDMARFGLLALNTCAWDGADVLRDKAYFAAATNTSQPLNPSYGYLWWLNGKSAYVLPGRQGRGNGPLVDAAPPDLYAALGLGDKKIYIVPSMGIVVTRHGTASEDDRSQAASRFDNLWWEKLSAALPR